LILILIIWFTRQKYIERIPPKSKSGWKRTS